MLPNAQKIGGGLKPNSSSRAWRCADVGNAEQPKSRDVSYFEFRQRILLRNFSPDGVRVGADFCAFGSMRPPP